MKGVLRLLQSQKVPLNVVFMPEAAFRRPLEQRSPGSKACATCDGRLV